VGRGRPSLRTLGGDGAVGAAFEMSKPLLELSGEEAELLDDFLGIFVKASSGRLGVE
jgi:hypothetical protein